MRTAAYIYVLSYLVWLTVGYYTTPTPSEMETVKPIERLCDCGYREYTHWKDRPLITN